MKRSGPTVTLKASCFDCSHCESEPYCIEDGNDCDSGTRVYCAEPSIVEESRVRSRRRIGDTTWTTPAWCPLLDAAMRAAKESTNA